VFNQSQSQELLDYDIGDFFPTARPCFIRVRVKEWGGEAEMSQGNLRGDSQ